ncbi:MAG: GntR family transcriptional regulator [Thermodesulfobacteriota bacterium]
MIVDKNAPNYNGDEWNKIEVKSLTAVVMDDLRMRIVTGQFKPGQKINESDIALRLGISRSPVREAFRLLERDGLITTVPRKGSYITDISVDDLKNLFEIRNILEPYAIDCIRKRAKKSPHALPAMIGELERSLLKKHDPFSVVSSFHYTLVELTSNSRLIELYKILAVSLRRYWLIYHSKKGQKDISFEHHQDIVNSLKSEDYSEAKKLLKGHLRYVENVVRHQVKEILTT